MKLLVALCSLLALAAAQPAKNDLWKGSSMDQMVDQTKIECAQKNDEVSCMKFKVLNLLDQIFRKDSFKASVGSGSIDGSLTRTRFQIETERFNDPLVISLRVENCRIVGRIVLINLINRRYPKRWR